MLKSKLLRIFSSMEETEIQLFSQFIRSPYFNSNQHLILFWELLCSARKQLIDEQLDDPKEFFFKKIFPQKEYEDGTMRKLMHGLTQSLERFLIQQELQNRALLNQKLLAEAYEKKNLQKEFLSNWSNLNKIISRSSEPALELFELYKQRYHSPDNFRLDLEEDNLDKAMQHLDEFYVTAKLHYSSELLNRQKAFFQDNSIPLLKEVQNFAQLHQAKNKIFSLYLTLHEVMGKDYEQKTFKKLENIYWEKIEALNKEKRYALLIYLINVITRAINKGHTHLSAKNLELYKKGITHKILIYNNRIIHETFTNIIIFAVNQKEIKFAKKFIQENQKYLDPTIKNDAIQFCKAVIFFGNQKYQEVIDQLRDYKFDKGLFDIRAKSILVRALVEQYLINNEFFQLYEQTTKSINRYFRRKEELGVPRIHGYLKLLKYSTKLVSLIQKNNRDNITWTKLKEDIEGEKLLFARKWLLEKIKDRPNK